MRTILSVLPLIACATVFQSAWAQAPSELPPKELAQLRTNHMAKAAKAFKGIRDADGSTIKPMEKPLMKWTNPVGSIPAGLLVGWEDENGVPIAIAQLWLTPVEGGERCAMELQSLSQEPFKLSFKEDSPWHPTGPGVKWAKFPGSPVEPSKNKALRLAQMRLLAKRFHAIDSRLGKSEVLRLQTNPVKRYSDKENGLIDGAIFVGTFEGTDPEVIIMIEYRSDSGGYQFALAPMTGFELRVSLNKKEVWHKPVHKTVTFVNDPFIMRTVPPLIFE